MYNGHITLARLRRAALRGPAIVPEMGAQFASTFRTTDVSNHPEVQRAAARFLDDPQFHQIVGIALSDKAEQLAIKKIGAQPNATWEKLSTS